jgi:hypothetical protein
VLSGGFAVLYGQPLISPSGLEVSAGAVLLLNCLPSELLGGVVESCVMGSRACQLGTLLGSPRESGFVLSEVEVMAHRSVPRAAP